MTTGEPSKEMTELELEHFFRGPPLISRPGMLSPGRSSVSPTEERLNLIPGLTLDETQAKELRGLALLPAMSALVPSMQTHVEEWAAFLSATRPEAAVPEFDVVVPGVASLGGAQTVRSGTVGSERRAFLHLLVIKALRKDRVVAAMEAYAAIVLGEAFPWRGVFDLEEVVRVQSTAASPLLLCSEPGHDASQKVRQPT